MIIPTNMPSAISASRVSSTPGKASRPGFFGRPFIGGTMNLICAGTAPIKTGWRRIALWSDTLWKKKKPDVSRIQHHSVRLSRRCILVRALALSGEERAMKIALLGPGHPQRGGIVHFNSRLALALQNRDERIVDLFYWSRPYPEFPSFRRRRSSDEESRLTFEQQGERILSYTNPLSWLRLVKASATGSI